MKILTQSKSLLLGYAIALTSIAANAAEPVDICPDAASRTFIHNQLETLLKQVQASSDKNGGFGFNMWATVVNRAGVVCAVAKSGADSGEQWPGSRIISAQKANTANSFSLPDFALSTANLYSAVQPGGTLFGLQESNPVDTSVAYAGDAAAYGTANDPMVGKKIGGVNVFGGGLPLYDINGALLGAVGVSGDSSCADHNIAWRMRQDANMDYVPGGVTANKDDNIIYDIDPTTSKSKDGWGHPSCSNAAKTIAEGFAKAGSGS
jgi:uncharacterized protein GlcG (DUF336 family)